MAKASPHAGPSKPPARQGKPIHRTIDLLKKNEGLKAKGKGKEKEVLGEVTGLVDEVKRLPGMIFVEKFAEARALEIHAFQTAIRAAAAQGNTRAFQSLPRHLRRRAASHNPRRVPKRLRSRAAAEIDAGDTIARKHRKQAKHRAKGSLRDRLSRTSQLLLRQRSKTWLPTHIWHAKRYHMVNLWGYRLPLTPTLKSFRPAYRAGRRRAIAWDTSYYGILELEGDKDELLQMLGHVVAGKFAGSKFECGSRMASVMVYHYNAFPRGLIGPAEVLWQPQEASDANLPKRLWLRLHPSIFNVVWDTLKLAAASQQTNGDVPSTSKATASAPIQIRDLRGDVESMEIMGPKAGKVLRRVLRLCKSESGQPRKFFELLGRLNDPAEIPEGTVVGLKVYDPRLNFPPSRVPETTHATTTDEMLRSTHVEPSSELAQSSLWDENLREDLSKATFTKFQLDARRHRLGVPGSKLNPLAQDDRIPILLIRRTVLSPVNPNTSESFHGFTLLLPPGWTMYLLSSLVYSNTLIGGLNERKVQYREAGLPSFPEYYGEVCEAGKKWEITKAETERERWSRKPPGKRVQWESLSTRNPFQPDWTEVIKGSKDGKDPTPAQTIKPWLLTSPFTQHLKLTTSADDILAMMNAFRTQRKMPSLAKEKATELFETALVHVEINLLGRGSPGDMAMIYNLPADLRDEWIAAYERGGLIQAGDISDLQQLGEVLPKEEEIIGYTSTGNISLSRGTGHGLGAITLKGYISLLEAAEKGNEEWKGRVLVRVRNRDGRVARFCEIRVVS
ncbi:hypothetical protein CI109_101465 [Kwoniella shandongensis]|uniref:Uncharacterized protein n=1 Tax=Kwoniella shandongensis TaxID=1734106 RepID=A0A5M6C319_9TREE|nr:uncharacterized protein CI109_001941 [Kwoniella shandongensis]KAA5529516.1 hypothetical protein CI109_001941 [Kwoniella shandongensis]